MAVSVTALGPSPFSLKRRRGPAEHRFHVNLQRALLVLLATLKIARPALVLSLIALSGWSTPARAQQPKDAALVNAVLDYRAHWAGDSTRVDACSAYNALGRPANFPAGIDTSLLRLLDRVREPCAADSARVALRWPRRFVTVESVQSGVPRVVLRIVKGEYSWRETYTLRTWPNGGGRPGVSVTEVRTWGLLQSHPVPPRRRMPAPTP